MNNTHIPIFDLRQQYADLQPEIDSTVRAIFEESAFISGQANTEFDKAFAQYCGAKRSVGVASGSIALDLALMALGVGRGDEVICPSHTFAATAEAIVHVGAKPVFVDIDEATYNIDPRAVAQAVTSQTKAIIAVDLYGQPAQYDELQKIATKHHLLLIEDAAQAHGAEYQGKKTGTFGDIACFSFFPAKNLGCAGDGGGVVTNSEKLADAVEKLKDHGRVSKYEHDHVGYGERLDNLQAAILLVKLPHLNQWNQRRRAIAKQYDQALSSHYTIPSIHPGATSCYYVYTLRHPKRDAIRTYLEEKGIATGIYYPHPLHLQKAFADLGYQSGDFPVTERVAQEIFSIPVYPELTDEQVAFIADQTVAAASSVA